MPIIATANLIEIFSAAFFQRALLVGGLMALAAAVLGVFVVVRRMAFYADAVAHASLTGVAVALVIGCSPLIGAIVSSLLVGILVVHLVHRGRQEVDTIIGVIFSAALAIGVLLLSTLAGYRGELMQYLFGDILAVRTTEVQLAVALCVAVLFLCFWAFKPLARIAVHEDLASADGLAVRWWDLLFVLLLSCTVAIGLRLVGAILMGALIILPAATAQYTARSLRGTIIWAIIFGLLAVVIGLFLSALFSLPSGPTIVVVAVVEFLIAYARVIIKT